MSTEDALRALGMRFRRVPAVDLAELDRELLDPQSGRLRLRPAGELLALGLHRLQAWAHLRARYQIITLELVEWLRSAIAGRRAIEVGAGMGDLGYHLGIHMTDSHVQTRNRVVRAFYEEHGEVPTSPPRDVERVDANTAVRLYKPEVVVACWLTQYGTAGVPESSSWGVHEDQFLDWAEYIHVGNLDSHSQKRVLALPHRVFTPAGLVSRGERQDQNAIFVWERPYGL